MSPALIDVWINCPDTAVARQIGDALLEARIVACTNVFAAIESAFHWQGTIERALEVPLLVKTRRELFDAVCESVASLHPYETPSVIGVPIEHVNEDYAQWVAQETRAPGQVEMLRSPEA